MFPFNEAIKTVAKIFALKMIHLHVDDKIEYASLQHLIIDKLSEIENAINAIKTKNLKVSLEFFKMAIASIKIKGLICETTLEYLKSAHNLSIHGYETVSSINDKLTAIKVTIASAILLYKDDATILNININACLEKIFNDATIRKTVSAECRNDFTFRPEYRKNFVNEFKYFVDNVMSHLSENVMVDEMEHKSLVDAQLLVPIFWNEFATNFLFWKEFNVVDKENRVKCLLIRDNIIHIGMETCTKIYEYVGNQLNLFHETRGIWYLEEDVDNEYTMHYCSRECIIMRNGDGKQVRLPLFAGDVLFPENATYIFCLGTVHSLTNNKFLHVHPSGCKTIVDVSFDAKENEQIVETELSCDGCHKITSGCVLNDGTIVVTARFNVEVPVIHWFHRGYLMILKKNMDQKFVKFDKGTFNFFALAVKTLNWGHLLVLTEYHAYVVYPKNNPHNCLSGDEQEEWAFKCITRINLINYLDGKKKIKLYGNNILIGCDDHFLIISRSAVNPIEYNVQKIYGTKSPIIDIDVFDDNTIWTLDKTGLIMTWSRSLNLL